MQINLVCAAALQRYNRCPNVCSVCRIVARANYPMCAAALQRCNRAKMPTVLTLIGIASLLGEGVVEGALRYANVVQYRIIVSLIVIPGLYTVSTRLLKRRSNRYALILSPGDREP